MPKSNLGTRAENMNMHNKANNVDPGDVNNSKPSSPGGVVVFHNISDENNSLEGMPTGPSSQKMLSKYNMFHLRVT